ncbi:mCG145853, partial [Mus musculus]
SDLFGVRDPSEGGGSKTPAGWIITQQRKVLPSLRLLAQAAGWQPALPWRCPVITAFWLRSSFYQVVCFPA